MVVGAEASGRGRAEPRIRAFTEISIGGFGQKCGSASVSLRTYAMPISPIGSITVLPICVFVRLRQCWNPHRHVGDPGKSTSLPKCLCVKLAVSGQTCSVSIVFSPSVDASLTNRVMVLPLKTAGWARCCATERRCCRSWMNRATLRSQSVLTLSPGLPAKDVVPRGL